MNTFFFLPISPWKIEGGNSSRSSERNRDGTRKTFFAAQFRYESRSTFDKILLVIHATNTNLKHSPPTRLLIQLGTRLDNPHLGSLDPFWSSSPSENDRRRKWASRRSAWHAKPPGNGTGRECHKCSEFRTRGETRFHFSPSLHASCNKRVEKETRRNARRRGEHAVSQLASCVRSRIVRSRLEVEQGGGTIVIHVAGDGLRKRGFSRGET